MRTLEETRPRHGLSVPVVTVLDPAGRLLEADQRALVRHVVQEGRGADILFAAGTTGEWDKLAPEIQRRAVQVCAEEASKLNAALTSAAARGVEVWAGVTAHSARETLENLEFACAAGADAAVLAPLSIADLRDVVGFVARDVSDLLDAQRRRIPVYLYDNADIAVDPRVPHLRTRDVKALSRLDFVRGIKVTAPRAVMGNYTKAAASFRERGDFGIYAGNASSIFELFRPRAGAWGSLVEHWNRWLLRDELPIGVVSGPANVFPREWAWAWQVCRAGDVARMAEAEEVLEAFRAGTWAAGGRRTIACIKRALRQLGVISSDAVARGTPELSAPDAERFDRVFEEVLGLARERIPRAWQTVVEGRAEGAAG
jgi:dihydrodipicolinate synthase/N-acetylneuraminate lyase